MSLRGIRFKAQQRVPVAYKGVDLGDDLVMDIFIEEQLVVELKAIAGLEPIHQVQLLTYLKLTGKHVGLLINFNVRLLKHGIKRMVL